MQMKHIVLIVVMIAVSTQSFAWDNPNKSPVPHVETLQATSLWLECRRVQNINGDPFMPGSLICAGMMTRS